MGCISTSSVSYTHLDVYKRQVVDTTGNANNATTITSGINIPGGAGEEEIVDVVDPLIEKMTSNVDVANKTAEITFKATDKYFANSTLTCLLYTSRCV